MSISCHKRAVAHILVLHCAALLFFPATTAGWNVLHRLASTAADLEAAPPPAGGITAQRVFELMQATQQRVHTVADELESRGTPAAQQIAQKLRDGCLRAPEPKAYYKGSAYMQRLQASALASAS